MPLRKRVPRDGSAPRRRGDDAGVKIARVVRRLGCGGLEGAPLNESAFFFNTKWGVVEKIPQV